MHTLPNLPVLQEQTESSQGHVLPKIRIRGKKVRQGKQFPSCVTNK